MMGLMCVSSGGMNLFILVNESVFHNVDCFNLNRETNALKRDGLTKQ